MAGGWPEQGQNSGVGGAGEWPPGLAESCSAAPHPPRPRPCPPGSGLPPSQLRLLARPWSYLTPHEAPASAVPPPEAAPPSGPAHPLAGVLVDGGQAQAQPRSRPGWAACLHGRVHGRPGREWGGQWTPSAAAFPHRGASLARAPPTGVGGRRARAGSSCCPRTQPQAHLLPSRPLSALPTPDLLGAFSLLPAQRNTASLAGTLPVQADPPTVVHVRLPFRKGQSGVGSGAHRPMAGGSGVCIRVGPSGPLGNTAEQGTAVAVAGPPPRHPRDQ